MIEAENIKVTAEARARAVEATVIKEAEAFVIKQHIYADTQANILRENADARLQVAKDKSTALIKESQAEQQNSSKMEGLRRFTEKMALADSLSNISVGGKVIVSGKNGQKVLDYFNDTIDTIGNRWVKDKLLRTIQK